MAIWGKLLGGSFGFLLGGPLGAIIGAVFGHSFDSGLERIALEDQSQRPYSRTDSEPELQPGQTDRVQMVFFTATFSVMGHIAKADGQVTKDEISWAEGIMDHMMLTPELRQAAIKLFNEGKQESFQLEPVVQQFRRECRRRTHLLQMFLEIQIQASLADGEVTADEDSVLQQLADLLGVSDAVFRQLQALVGAAMGVSSSGYGHAGRRSGAGSGSRQAHAPSTISLSEACRILGVSESADKAEVKKAYRRLMSQHHPDKLVAKGLPEEMIKLATEKTQQIQKAYEVVKSALDRK